MLVTSRNGTAAADDFADDDFGDFEIPSGPEAAASADMGATVFTDLPGGPVTVLPRQGKAVLWSSVLADEPDKQDPRTHHEALPVTKGTKYAINVWIRERKFV